MSADNASPPTDQTPALDSADPRVADCIRRYWRRNVAVMLCLIAIWAIAGLGCGVLFADALNAVRIGGFRLGFWFAHQGAIAIFIFLSLIYCIAMNRLDRDHHAELMALRAEGEGENGKDGAS